MACKDFAWEYYQIRHGTSMDKTTQEGKIHRTWGDLRRGLAAGSDAWQGLVTSTVPRR